MLENFSIYLPSLNKEVRVQVSIPKNYRTSGIEFDTLYMLDGQNIYKDYLAAFGRSLHMGRYLAIMAKQFDKHIVGVAIDNALSDMGRINEYTPFPLEDEAQRMWPEQDLEICQKYTYDFIHTIIPYIQRRYPVKKDAKHTYIMGSSLGALYASFLGNEYPDVFGVAGLFSNCPFLCEKAYYSYLKEKLNRNLRVFHYVGLNESSDGEFDAHKYYNSSKKLHEYLKTHNVDTHLCVDINGIHNEETWERHVLQFLSFIYFEDITLEF